MPTDLPALPAQQRCVDPLQYTPLVLSSLTPLTRNNQRVLGVPSSENPQGQQARLTPEGEARGTALLLTGAADPLRRDGAARDLTW